MPSRPCILALLLLTLAAAGLRTVALGQSLWLDELHTAWTVAGGWSDVASRAMQGNQSPLYYAVLYPLQLLGGGEIALRLPSLAAGVLLVPLMFVAGRRFTGSDAAGLLAAALVAVDRDCLFYSQEARPYAWVQLVGLGHVLVFERLLAEPRIGRRLLLIGGGLLLFYLHYTAALLLLVEFVAYGWLSARRATRPAYRPTSLLRDFGTIALGCLPMAGHLLGIATRRAEWEPFVPPPDAAWLLRQFRGDVTMAVPALVVGLTLVARKLAAALGVEGVKPPVLKRPAARPTTLVLVWALLPRLLAAAVTHAGWLPLALGRYLIVSAAAPILFAAGCWATLRSPVTRAALAVALVGLMVHRGGLVPQFQEDGRLIGDRREDWALAVETINRLAAPRTPVFLCSGLLEDGALRERESVDVGYFRFPVAGLYRLREDLPVRPLPTRGRQRMGDEDLAVLLQQGRGWWLVRGKQRLVEAVVRDLRGQVHRRGWDVRLTHRAAWGNLTAFRAEIE